MYENVDPSGCTPPGTYSETIPHPGIADRNIEKAIIMEHRFAFFFWMKWRSRLQDEGLITQSGPTLISIDWHRDLAPTPEKLKESLLKLDPSNLSEVSNYVWARFDQTNDGHIGCATWLNIVGDVILLENSGGERQDIFVDHEGNDHTVYEFQEFSRFQEFILRRNDPHIFFDIDLDYFIHGKGSQQYSENFDRYSTGEIKEIIDLQHPLFNHILPTIEGMTIALEPGYCGGITNSCKIMEVVHSQLFDGKKNWNK